MFGQFLNIVASKDSAKLAQYHQTAILRKLFNKLTVDNHLKAKLMLQIEPILEFLKDQDFE